MGKKSKKQRPKKQDARSRRESGMVLRSGPHDQTVTGVLAVQDASPPVVTDEREAPEVEAAEVAAAGGPEASRHAMRPHELTATEAADAPSAEIHVLNRSGRSPAMLDGVHEGPRGFGGCRTALKPAAEPDEGSGDSTPPAVPSDEHRASRRVSVAVDIHLASDSHFFSGLSGDISEGGLFFSTYRPLDVGTEVDLEFSLPGSERALRARGEVRWIRDHSAHQPRGVGIAFENLSDDDRERIHAFCSSRPPLYYEDVG